MDKRYQVFVSSTYADLKEERRRVIQTLMEMDCIPAGMELFPAADDEQWSFIRRVIDDCDYYILIIGGRYGSVTATGVSYTEKEYEYAIERGLKVLAFVHENPGDIPVAKSDIDPILRDRLAAFRARVMEGRLVRFWTRAEELPGLVALSLSKTIKAYPAVGWVRGNLVANVEALSEVNALQRENAALQRELESHKTAQRTSDAIPDLASLDSVFTVTGTYSDWQNIRRRWTLPISWKGLFALIAPYLLQYPPDGSVSFRLGEQLGKQSEIGKAVSIDPESFDTIKVQLIAHGLVSVNYTKTTKGGMGLFWSLTKKGQRAMMLLRTVKDSPTTK